ncbi:MAG: FkbM family methyltransferase [Phycisphaeraceae bacterium]|nr:FkbM family methyltransferase [Phycisphaeraceae bacterium]
MPVRRMISGALHRAANRIWAPAAPSQAAASLTSPELETRVRDAASTLRALTLVRDRGHQVSTVVDIGASDGRWSAAARSVFPGANYLLIEAQELHRKSLEAYCAGHPGAEFCISAAGPRADGMVYFEPSGEFAGSASEHPTDKETIKIPVTSIDHELAKRAWQGPFLLKLDTHGFEVPILEGARRTLEQTEILVIETYNFRLSDNALMWHEMVAFLDRLGFGVVDFSEPLWRVYDRTLWQMDLFFVPKRSEEFKYVNYA